MNMHKTLIIFSLSLLLKTNLVHASEHERYLYSPSDVLSFKRVSQVVASDDGRQVAYVIYQVKAGADGKKWEYSLYLKNNNNFLLDKSDTISSVSWSPNNKFISYLAKGKIFQSIWIVDVYNKKKQKILEFTNDIVSFKWSPDGKYIAYTSNEPIQKNKALVPIDVAKDYVNTRLYIFNIDKKSTRVLTPNKFSLSQFFVYPGFDWAPDSQSIVFSYQPKPGSAYDLENKIGTINLKTNKMVNLPYSENHNSTQPTYSFDGKYIAFQSSLPADDKSNKLSLLSRSRTNQICVSNTNSLETYCLKNTFNQNPIMIGWNQSSDQVLVFDPYYKTEGPKIYALSLKPTDKPKLLSEVPGFIEPLTISLNNKHTVLGFGYETVSNAPQAFISQIDPFKLEQVSQLPVQVKKLGEVKVIQWPSTDGFSIEGLLITPANYDPKKKYPLFVNIHGGPASAWSKRYLGGCDEYETMIDPTTCYANLLDLGFVILQPNPRGSDGYGAAFRLANLADVGGGEYRDIIAGVDYLVGKGIADSTHLAIGGWSYGGYLSAWAISQTNRFKSAIDGDGNTNWISYAGTSSQPLFALGYFGGEFWNDDRLYIQRSTVMHVKNIATPLLIMHGENDIGQVPITQSKELYTDLEQQNKNVKMLVLPQQGHVPRDANIIFECIKEVDNWLMKAL